MGLFSLSRAANSNCLSPGVKINVTIKLCAIGVHQTRVFISGVAQVSPWKRHPAHPSNLLLQRSFNTGELARKTALVSIKKSKKNTPNVIFLGGLPSLKSCYYNTKLDLGFSKESKVISCPIPTRLPRELEPKCLWLFWKTSSITEIHRVVHQKLQKSKV